MRLMVGVRSEPAFDGMKAAGLNRRHGRIRGRA